jgi:hypothetical protein
MLHGQIDHHNPAKGAMTRTIERTHTVEMRVIYPDKVVAHHQLAKTRICTFQVGNDNRLAARILLFEESHKRRGRFGVLHNGRHTDMADILAQEMHERDFAIGAVPAGDKQERSHQHRYRRNKQ